MLIHCNALLILGKETKISEFNDLCCVLLGKWASHLATVFSVLAIVGAAIVYWVLLSNFLFSTVNFIHGKPLALAIVQTVLFSIWYSSFMHIILIFQTTMKTEMRHIKREFIALKMPPQTLLVDL